MYSFEDSGGTLWKAPDSGVTVRCGIHSAPWVMYYVYTLQRYFAVILRSKRNAAVADGPRDPSHTCREACDK